MNTLQILVVSTLSGIVSGLVVILTLIFMPAPDFVGGEGAVVSERSKKTELEPVRCDVPEECHLFRRGTPYKIMGSKIFEGELMVQVEAMDVNIEPRTVLSRQPSLRTQKPGTIFMLIGTSDIRSGLVILSLGQAEPLSL